MFCLPRRLGDRWWRREGSSSNVVRNALSTDEFIFLPYPFPKGPTVGKGVDALAVEPAVPELPDIPIAVGKGVSALTVKLTKPELTDILIAGGKGVGALAVRPTSNRHIGSTRRQSALPIG